MSELVPPEVLAAWGLEGAEVTEFERGLINKHWLARRGNVRLVVRRYNEVRTRDAVAWEQGLVGFAATKGWPVAAPIASASGTVVERAGRLWAVAPCLPGDSRVDWDPNQWRRRGELLAQLHLDLAGFPLGQRPDFGTSFEVDTWLAQAGAGGFDEVVAAFVKVEPELGKEISKRRGESVHELTRLGYESLPRLPLQGDFKDLNLLWTAGELTGLLDFNYSRRDVHVYDLADVLVPFMPLDPEAAKAIVAGYESVRRLTSVERSLIAPLAKSSLVWWVTILLGAWSASGEVPGGIARTMTVRFPALDAMIPRWRDTWGF